MDSTRQWYNCKARFVPLLCLSIVWVLLTGDREQLVSAFQFFPPASRTASEDEISPGNDDFPGVTALKPSRKLIQVLKQAKNYAADGKYDSAIILWQRILDSSRDEIISGNPSTKNSFANKYRGYESVTRHVEQRLAGLPTEGLRTYRLRFDGNAKSLLTEGRQNHSEKKLTQIVRQYFLSSYGDDAAFYLAGLRYDQGNSVSASRLLRRILDDYPNPSVKPGRVLLRLAVLNAKFGDLTAAQAALTEIKGKYRSDVSSKAIQSAEREINRFPQTTETVANVTESWRIELGGAARNRVMLSLPEGLSASESSELWTDRFNMKLTGVKSVSGSKSRTRIVVVNGLGVRTSGSVTTTVSPAQMIDKWKQNGWTPSGQMLFEGKFAYFKNENRLVCRDAETGELLWMGRKNRFELDSFSNIFNSMGRAVPTQNGRPSSLSEVQLFGDRVFQSMSICNGVVFTLEGRLLESGEKKTSDLQRPKFRPTFIPSRDRVNWLSAYDAVTGKFKWDRSAQEEGKPIGERIGFLAAPVPFDHLLLVPVTDNGELWLYALASSTGTTRWKTYLCDEPLGGSSPWIPVGVSVEGGDAYVATGTGLVLALDAAAGSVHWAVRYRRSGYPVRTSRPGHRIVNYTSGSKGWDLDMAIPHRNRLIVFASDYDHLFVLDRRQGKLLWDSPRKPANDEPAAQYCLGIAGDGLFVAGKNVVRRYSISSGRIEWKKRISNSYGRGALTEDAIYVPEGESVVQRDLATGKQMAQSHLFLTSSAPEPVGNVYSDGSRLFVVGMARVAALADLDHLMQTLKTRIELGEANAHLTRMRLYSRLGNIEQAIDDLQNGYRIVKANKSRADSHRILYESFKQLNLIESRPELVLELIADSEKNSLHDSSTGIAATTHSENDTLPKELINERTRILHSALSEARETKERGVVGSVLRVIPLTSDRYLLRAAQQTIAAVVDRDDRKTIEKALQSKNVQVRIAAIFGISGTFGEKASPQYEKMVAEKDDRVRLTAALALANRGSRVALPVLGDLLESDVHRIRAQSAQALRAFTAQRFSFTSYSSLELQAEAVKAWKTWIETEGLTAKLHFPVDPMSQLLGRTLICDQTKSRLIELDADGNQIWEQPIVAPYSCQGLSNGHRLVAFYTNRTVVEFDEEGNEVWEIEDLPSAPYSVRRLPNGNTLVACYRSRKVLEFKPDKTIEWELKLKDSPRDARRLENGNTLVTLYDSGRIVELNLKGETVWQFSNIQRPQSAQRLENGNTLISLYYAGEVVEVDRDGNVVWSKKSLKRAYYAQRLPNGNTIICSFSGVQEINTKGDVVWERKGPGLRKAFRF
jgi:outer membrane protein assembly factor BamB/TolA-binding protein